MLFSSSSADETCGSRFLFVSSIKEPITSSGAGQRLLTYKTVQAQHKTSCLFLISTEKTFRGQSDTLPPRPPLPSQHKPPPQPEEERERCYTLAEGQRRHWLAVTAGSQTKNLGHDVQTESRSSATGETTRSASRPIPSRCCCFAAAAQPWFCLKWGMQVWFVSLM